MMKSIVLVLLVILAITDGRPQDLQDSIASVLKSLEVSDSQNLMPQQRRSRPRIITKYDFMPTRDKKSHLELPPEFVVSTDLRVTQRDQDDVGTHQRQHQALPHRSGRSHNMFGSRQAKTNFINLAKAVEAAPVITGVRLPDDETDHVVHRNGRFINNVFVPNSVQTNSFLPQEFVVRTQIAAAKKPLERTGRSYLSQYEEPGAYTFEPSMSHTRQDYQTAILPNRQEHQTAILPASNEDFVIKEQTYQMCPTCPTFNIPVPVPRQSAPSNEVINTDLDKNKSIMEKLMEVIQPAIENAKEFFSIDTEHNEASNNGFANRLSSGDPAGDTQLSGSMYAGIAAMGLGIMGLISSGMFSGGLMNVGRQFDEDIFENINSIDNEVLEYTMGDILCMPRNYCEKLKKKKYLIDQYPHMKTVATWMAEKYFEKVDTSENQIYSQCNVRKCIMALLN